MALQVADDSPNFYAQLFYIREIALKNAVFWLASQFQIKCEILWKSKFKKMVLYSVKIIVC